jgi:endonuclease III
VANATTIDKKRQATKVTKALAQGYADAECALKHDTPEQLLIATILSAQCTDERVNLVTAVLFAAHPTPEEIARLPIAKLEQLIQSTGFFRNKAKNIKSCCQKLVELHDGRVPRSLEELVALPGVGRKTANVVLGTSYGLPTGVVVDTHVARLSKRLGLVEKNSAEQIERELMELLAKKQWINFSHRMIHHGRRVCNARRPKCSECSMLRFCPQLGVERSQ